MTDKIIETVKEGKTTFNVYDPKHYEISNSIYAFPFDYSDQSPTKKKNSGRGLGVIEWNIEPRKFEYDKELKKYYITQIYLWASQTRDARYYGKVFGLSSYTDSLCASVLESRKDTEKDAIKQAWRVQPSLITKTLMFQTYPPKDFNFLILNLSSSLGADIKYVKFNPNGDEHYNNYPDYNTKLTKLLNEKHGWKNEKK